MSATTSLTEDDANRGQTLEHIVFSSHDIWLEQAATAHSFEWLGWSIYYCCFLYQILIYETCKLSLNLSSIVMSPCATSDIIFNLLKAISIW